LTSPPRKKGKAAISVGRIIRVLRSFLSASLSDFG